MGKDSSALSGTKKAYIISVTPDVLNNTFIENGIKNVEEGIIIFYGEGIPYYDDLIPELPDDSLEFYYNGDDLYVDENGTVYIIPKTELGENDVLL